MRRQEAGFTLVELTVTLFVFLVIALSLLGLFTTLVNSTVVAKREAVASALATNQMEYIKSLPYDNLAVAGGSIVSTKTIPATVTQKVNGVTYTITTSINYVDDQYDGCGSYPNKTLEAEYCRGYSSSTTTTVDTNPQDYKIVHVTVSDATGTQLAQVDTEIAARVSETASSTGALFVSVIDNTGNPVAGVTVHVTDSTVSPAVDVSDSTDNNGTAIFYGLTPDNGTDYVITASKSGYSTLGTIKASGTLQPTYPNQKILTQQSSYVTLTLEKQGADSLVIETTDTSGNPLSGVKVYVKGGYKKYTSATDTSYYYDTMSPSDIRPTTDANGLSDLTNLVPGSYIFCGDDGTSNCSIGGTTYYLAAAVPYGGANSLGPITVPTYDPSNPPSTTYSYGGDNYLQKVRLMLTTSSGFPRVYTLNPYDLSLAAGNLSSVQLAIGGYNLSSASASLSQGGNTYSGTGCTSSANQLTCNFNLTGITTGTAQLSVTNGSGTLTLPTTPLGGFNVDP